MSARDDLARLGRLAALLRDDRLARLSAAEAACAGTRSRLAGLQAETAAGEDPADWQNALAYRRWTEARRSVLEAQLQAQTTARDALLPETRRAFGRAEALARLAKRRV
jgi:hypothetical protein